MATGYIYIDEMKIVRRHHPEFLSNPFETLVSGLEPLGATEIVVHRVPPYVSFFYYDGTVLRRIKAYVLERPFLRLETKARQRKTKVY